MTSPDPAPFTIAEMAERLRRGDTSSEEVTRLLIERTEALEPHLNSYIRFLPERALEEARRMDRDISRGAYRGPLHGVPYSLKDLFDVEGLPTTGGARFLESEVASTDSYVARRLRSAGAVLLGKANLNKFAGGESGDNPDYGKIRNPWNLGFSAGGSSGGSGAQVAAGLVPLSVGSDNAGSVRIPAALCGVVGLKPTFGRISMEGMFPRAYTFDHPGILTRRVADAALALEVLAGHEDGDGTTADVPVPDYHGQLKWEVRGVRLGVDRGYMSVVQPEVETALNEALTALADIGVIVQDVMLPSAAEMRAVFREMFGPEWGAAHEPWLRSHPDEYPDSWAARANLMTPAVNYIKAARRRRLLQVEYARATQGVDLVLMPTYPLDRRPFDDYPEIAGRTITFNDALRYTMPFDLLGLPAISVPCGFSPEGFPVGMQLAGRAFDESTVLRVAHAYESVADWHERQPESATLGKSRAAVEGKHLPEHVDV